jgi:hypothetical protein
MRNSAMKFLTALGFVGALAIALPSASWGRTRAAAAFRTMTARVPKRPLTAEVPTDSRQPRERPAARPVVRVR